MKNGIAAVLVGLAASSCAGNGAGSGPTSVRSTLENRADIDRTLMTVRGRIESQGEYFNIFGGDDDTCIGLLIEEKHRPEFERKAGKIAIVDGFFEAEGCGQDGICVEELCRPDIMTNARIVG